MDRYPKRLIEVDLPIKRISGHARREKYLSTITSLHLWWARRPLAACRAVICAALWPDPVDELCPSAFREAAFHIMSNFAQDAMNNRTVRDELLSEITLGKAMTIKQASAMFRSENPNANSMLRYFLLDFIADFANWDASTNPLFLKTARALTQVAHEAFGGAPGTRPLVVDPFAGGGSIPLEALRIGADAFASDLNPVAVLLNRVVLEYIPKYGQQLADEVLKWGRWIKKEAEKELQEFYPKDPDGGTPIAYLWARTIRCEGPRCGAEVPLIRSLWLAKKANHSVAVQLVPNRQTKHMDFQIIIKHSNAWVDQEDSRNKIEAPKFDGTVKRGAVVCPCCGYTTPVGSVREQLKKRGGGANDGRLMCVVVTRASEPGRFYRLPTRLDIQSVQKAADKLEKYVRLHNDYISPIPDEPTPQGGGSGAGRAFSQRNYGMNIFANLFTKRQLLTLTTLVKCLQEAKTKIQSFDEAFADALQTVLALAVSRESDHLNSLCSWNPSGEKMQHLYTRQALPIVWDFCETNPFGESVGDWNSTLECCLSALHAGDFGASPGIAAEESAQKHSLPDNSANGFVTDPPYYDAVPYADLSDFFYVWLKRTVRKADGKVLTPKEDECIVDEIKGKDNAFFERTMRKAMAEGRRILIPSGIGVIVFAHKSTSGWEAQLQAMIDAGWIITASWPIDTELATRLRARDSAALASSIHLVCRPRENSDGSQPTDDIGDWRDVLNELPKRIHEWMPRLAQESVVGADAIFACLGPALEIFSRYSSVEKASGEKVELKEYLEQVWAAVAREALNMIFQGADASGFEEDARLTAMWLWTLRTSGENGHSTEAEEDNESEENGKPKPVAIGGYSLEYDAARKIAQGLGAHLEALGHLVEIKGETAILLPVGARTRYLFGKEATRAPQRRRKKAERQLAFDFAHELEDVEEEAGLLPGNLSARPGATVLDQLHQSMILFGAGRGEALKRFLVDEGVGQNRLFWRLAQSLLALYPPASDEKRWVDGVLARKKGLGL